MEGKEEVLPEDDTLFLEAAWRHFVKRLSHCKIYEEMREVEEGEKEKESETEKVNEYVLSFGGTWNIAANGICCLNLQGDKMQTSEGLQEFFRRVNRKFEGIPWLLVVYPHNEPKNVAEKIAAITHTDGKTPLFIWPSKNIGMVMKIEEGEEPPSSWKEHEERSKDNPIRIEEVSPETLAEYVKLQCLVFSAPLRPPSVPQAILAQHKGVSTEGPPYERFVGIEEATNKVICTASYMIFGKRGVGFELCTLPEYRRRGYAAAMVRGLIQHGRVKYGTTSFYIHASDMGRSLYEALGFRGFCEIQEFFSATPEVQAKYE